MTPAGTPDPEYPNEASENGTRKDMVNLIDTWLKERQVGDVERDSPLPTAPPQAWGQASLIPPGFTRRAPATSGTGRS